MLVQNVSTKWDPYADFYSFLNWGLFNRGGNCYGFSSTAVLYFQHYALGDQTTPYYPETTPSVAALPGQTGKYCLLGQCLAQGDTLYQSTFPIYIHQWYDPNNAADVPSNEQPYVQQLEQGINRGLPVILALGPTDFHAVVAWKYNLYSNGNLVIGISDPNYGNVIRYAYCTNGEFSYQGSASWSTFSVISPGILQWSWLSGFIGGGTVITSDRYSDQYYTYVFSDTPITIFSGAGYANFTVPGNSLSFSSTISGAVGFEEGGIQAYAIPQGVQYMVQDPGTTSSRLLVVIPQNETSSVGYELESTSSVPLSLAISPSLDKLNVTSANAASLSITLFSVGPGSHSVLNATSIPVTSTQTAVVSVQDWSRLNSTSSPASLQLYSPGSTQPVTSYTLTNGQRSPSPAGQFQSYLLPTVVILTLVAAGIVLVYSRRRNSHRTAHQSHQSYQSAP